VYAATGVQVTASMKHVHDHHQTQQYGELVPCMRVAPNSLRIDHSVILTGSCVCSGGR